MRNIILTLLLSSITYAQSVNVRNVKLTNKNDKILLELGSRLHTCSPKHEFEVAIYKDNKLTTIVDNKVSSKSLPLFSIRGSKHLNGELYLCESNTSYKVIKRNEIFEFKSLPGEYLLFVTELFNNRPIKESSESLIIR